jgi:hypothetical protein
MKQKETFYTADRNVWRKWLEENFETKNEIWFVFPRKNRENRHFPITMPWKKRFVSAGSTAQRGHLDDKHGIRRFTPRKNFGYYSRPNIERLIWLDKQGLIHPKIRPTVVSVMEVEFIFPEDIMNAIREDEIAWKNYQKFSEPYKRIRIAYIDAARKRPEEFKKRLNSFLEKTRNGKMIVGFGGIEKYYV